MSYKNDRDRYLTQIQKGKPKRDQVQAGRDVHITNSSVPPFTVKDSPQSSHQPSTELASRTDIFLSHWSAEKPLALLLADWITRVFPDRFTVFTSSDAAEIKVGDRWLDEVEKALQSAKLALVVASKGSLERHWVNFEAGFAWSRGIPVVFLCHSGLQPSLLPRPYSARQSLDVQEPGFPENFLKSLAQHFNISRLPPLAFPDLEKQLADALRQVMATNIK